MVDLTYSENTTKRQLYSTLSHVPCVVNLTGDRDRQAAPPVVNMVLSIDTVVDKEVGKL